MTPEDPQFDDESGLANRARTNITQVAVGFEAALVLLAVFLGWMWDLSPLQRTGGAGNLAADVRAMGWGVVFTIPGLLLLMILRMVPFAPFQKLNQQFDKEIVPWFRSARWPELALISLAAGVGEEMLFRGVLMSKAELWWGTTGAVVATSILFGVAHWLTATYAAVTLLVGLYLALLTLWFDNLFVAIVAHALYDFLALLILTRGSGGEEQPAAATSDDG